MPSRSWNTRTWPSVKMPAPIPMTGMWICGMSASAIAAGSGHRDHLVHPDGRRGVITEHDHRGRVPDQDDVDSSFFSHEPGGVVVGGDHDDGLTIRLHLGDTRERHRRSVGLVWL